MCGIFGYYTKQGNSIPEQDFDAMGHVISYRGPNGRGKTVFKGVGIGNERLSIIDIEGGGQPFFSDDNQIALVQNGEIFNYVELAEELVTSGYSFRSHSDTEVILRLYERDGIAFVDRLNGMFAIAIHDRRQDCLYLIRDRMGVKPLYFYEDEHKVLFGSEIKCLLATGIRRELDLEAMHHLLTFNYVPPPLTAFKGIWHLPPGHWMKISQNGTEIKAWWSLARQPEEERSEEAWKDEFLTTLEDATRLRLRADVPFGAFLSGGLDSSSIVAFMARHMKEPVQTFTIGFEDPRFDESAFAQVAATRFRTRHTMVSLSEDLTGLWPLTTYHCDQPHGDASFMPYYRVSELAAQHVTMVLTGDGGDELFGGYAKYAQFFRRAEAFSMPESNFQVAYHRHISVFSEREKMELYTEATASALSGANSHDVSRAHFRASSHLDRINQALYLDCMLLLPGNNLVKPDRMPMAASLEARNPFMDVRMVELAFRMPGKLKVRNGETRYLYKQAVRTLIGEELTFRKKQMFTVSIGEWFKDRLRNFAEEILLSTRTLNRGLFKQSSVRKLLEEHLSGTRDRTREIRLLISIELWARIFLDSSIITMPSIEELGAQPLRP